MANTNVGIGTKFNAVYADGMCQWEVTGKAGRAVWKCVVTQESGDYVGVVKHFGTDEIRLALAWMAAFDSAKNGDDSFYESLPLGKIVHYHNSFGEFVRCEVVMASTEKSDGKAIKCLKPIALVGNWKGFDLPRRNRDGSIELGYHAKKIVEGRCWRASASCVYESPRFSDRAVSDPRKMEPISLEVPPMDAAAEQKARLEQIRQSVKEILDNYESDPVTVLKSARDILVGVNF